MSPANLVAAGRVNKLHALAPINTCANESPSSTSPYSCSKLHWLQQVLRRLSVRRYQHDSAASCRTFVNVQSWPATALLSAASLPAQIPAPSPVTTWFTMFCIAALPYSTRAKCHINAMSSAAKSSSPEPRRGVPHRARVRSRRCWRQWCGPGGRWVRCSGWPGPAP